MASVGEGESSSELPLVVKFISVPLSVCGKILLSPPWHVDAVRSVRATSFLPLTPCSLWEGRRPSHLRYLPS